MPAAARRQAPAWWARGLIVLATRPLPAAARGRYRREFRADLHGMSRTAQANYASHVLACSLPLRLAIRSGGKMSIFGEIDMVTRRRRPLRCRLNLHHDWHGESADDGTRYLRCRRCGKDGTGPVVISNEGSIAAQAANLFGMGGGSGL